MKKKLIEGLLVEKHESKHFDIWYAYEDYTFNQQRLLASFKKSRKFLKSSVSLEDEMEYNYVYDENGILNKETDKNLKNESSTEIVYNSNGKIIQKNTYSNDHIKRDQYEYDTNGKLTKESLFSDDELTSEYVYDYQDETKAQKNSIKDGESTLDSTVYFNENGNITKIQHNEDITEYHYDDKNRRIDEIRTVIGYKPTYGKASLNDYFVGNDYYKYGPVGKK